LVFFSWRGGLLYEEFIAGVGHQIGGHEAGIEVFEGIALIIQMQIRHGLYLAEQGQREQQEQEGTQENAEKRRSARGASA